MERNIQGISVEIVSKNIKHMYLRVKPDGKVLVSAPWRMTVEEIDSFVGAKRDWIIRQQEKLLNSQSKPPLQYVTGEEVCVWGLPYRLEIKLGNIRRSPVLKDGCLEMTVKAEDGPQEKERQLNAWYRKILQEEIALRLPRWEQAMGLYCEKWQVRDMKTRWGSCNTQKKRLWFALQLTRKPLFCLDYVLVHELAHLEIPNHGPQFWRLVETYVPKWKKLRLMLR